MKNLRDVPSPGPQAYDSARTALQEAMAEPAPVLRPKRWVSWPKLSVAAIGAAAVATAVVMGTTSTSVPTGTPVVAAPQPVVVDSPLLKLASEVKAAAGPLTGDSSLVVITKPMPDGSPYVTYSLYTDKGPIFVGDSLKNLSETAKKNDDQARPFDRNVLSAARLAATGDLEKAKVAMVTAAGNPLGLGLSDAEADKEWEKALAANAEIFQKKGMEVPPAKPRPTGKELEDRVNNSLWHNTTYAMLIGAANPEVREGVLKLLATLKDVTIANADVDGQAAITLTAGPALLLASTGSHVISIDAGNGLPIRSAYVPAKDSGEKGSAANYKSSRVTLADVLAGKI
ncbi:hypothetical protein [Lentzea waywayandensis]|nr:hypothetical protein [Lentzea waywayandensis]